MLEQIKQLDIKQIISDETKLNWNKNTLSQCPFCGSGTHKNGTSAFSVKNNSFKCFSCNKSGSIIDFIIEYKKTDFKGATKYLAKKYGLDIPKQKTTGEFTDWEKKIYAIKQQLKKPAFDYLKNERQIIPDKLPANAYYYDSFANAVVFFDSQYKTINKRFIVPEQGKPKAIFERGSKNKNIIYDATFRKEEKTVFIAEGVINALSLYQLGYSVIATFTTSNLIDETEFLKKYFSGRDVIIAFDPDEAGTKAANYYKKFIADNIKIKTLREFTGLSYKKDFNDYLTKLQSSELKEIINNTDNYEYLIYPITKIPLKSDVYDEEAFEKENKFYFKNSKYFQVYRKNDTEMHFDVSDCVWSFLYRIIDSNEDATHLIKLQRKDNDGKLIIKLLEASTDEIQKDKFEKRLNNIGFSYYGSANTFNKIKVNNLHNELEVTKIEKYGYHPEHNLFFWTNVAVSADGEVLKPNELGILTYNGKAFYLETQSPANINKKIFTELRKFNYKKGSFNISDFISTFYKAYGSRALVGITYLTSSLFRDIIFEEINRFPNLYLYGIAGSGKSAFTEIILAAQGDYTGGYSLTDTSQAAFSRVVDSRINSLVYLKEYNETLPSFVDEFFKTAYEGQGRTIGVKSSGNEIISYQALTGMLIDANFLPIAQEAVFSRMIILDFNKTIFSKSQTEAFNILKKEQRKGLSQISVNILAHRDEFKDFFAKEYNEKFTELKNNFKNMNDRIIIHGALLVSVFDFIAKIYELYDFGYDYMQYVIEIMKTQEERLLSFKNTRVFWQAFAVGIKNNLIKDIDKESVKQDYVAYFRIKAKEKVIALKSSDFKVFTQIYAKYCKDIGLKPIKPNLLREALINSEQFMKNISQKSRNTNITHIDSKLSSSLYFYYKSFENETLIIDDTEIELN